MFLVPKLKPRTLGTVSAEVKMPEIIIPEIKTPDIKIEVVKEDVVDKVEPATNMVTVATESQVKESIIAEELVNEVTTIEPEKVVAEREAEVVLGTAAIVAEEPAKKEAETSSVVLETPQAVPTQEKPKRNFLNCVERLIFRWNTA